MSEKIYCGKGKSNTYGIRANVCLSDIPEADISEFQGKKYIKLDINKLRQVDKKGNDYTIIVNTWKPQGQQQNTPPQSETTEDLPWR